MIIPVEWLRLFARVENEVVRFNRKPNYDLYIYPFINYNHIYTASFIVNCSERKYA